MQFPDWLLFFQRTFPSANMVAIKTRSPVLIDTGFGSDLAETERLLREAGVPPESLSLIVNTHYHSDHVGGNSGLQRRYGTPVAAHRWEADMVNRRDPEACSARWLDQPIEPYQVNRRLSDGDEIDAGGITLQALHTPGHTLGHIALYAPDAQILICGDTVHLDDVAWVGIFREGAGALERMMDTLERMKRLPVRWACSGHGPAIGENLAAAIDAALRRYERWLDDPQKMAWHACKRIFAYKLMLVNGLLEREVVPYLLRSLWFQDYSRAVFGLEPPEFVQPLLEEMLRSGAAGWRDGRLVALAPHTAPPLGWYTEPGMPGDWPKIAPTQS